MKWQNEQFASIPTTLKKYFCDFSYQKNTFRETLFSSICLKYVQYTSEQNCIHMYGGNWHSETNVTVFQFQYIFQMYDLYEKYLFH